MLVCAFWQGFKFFPVLCCSYCVDWWADLFICSVCGLKHLILLLSKPLCSLSDLPIILSRCWCLFMCWLVTPAVVLLTRTKLCSSVSCLTKFLPLSSLLCLLVLFSLSFIVCVCTCSPPADTPSSTASVWTVYLRPRLLLLALHSNPLVPRSPFASTSPSRLPLLWGHVIKPSLTNHPIYRKRYNSTLMLIHNSLAYFFSIHSRKLRPRFCFSRYRGTAPSCSLRGPEGLPLSPPVPPSLLSSTPTIPPCNSWAWPTCPTDSHRQVC